MMKQFLRKVFAGRRQTGDMLDSAELAAQAVDDIHIYNQLENRYELVLTQAEQGTEIYEKAARMVEELAAKIEVGKQVAFIRLRIEGQGRPDAERIHACMDRIERETYDATALLDWGDVETARLYRMYVLPTNPEKQETFVQSRMVMIYDTCEALGMKPRPRARLFVEAVGWELHEDDFEAFEEWLSRMSEAPSGEATVGDRVEDDLSHITPLQISRDEVESEDISKIDAFFIPLLQDAASLASRKESLVFSFYGFSGQLEDMMNHAAVNAWASKLVEEHPYVFYVLNDDYVPMTQFVTSMVVTSHMENNQVVFDEEELKEFIQFIRAALTHVAARTGEDPVELAARFESCLFAQS